jgi:quercetin dioxygenase-like cupin family protein
MKQNQRPKSLEEILTEIKGLSAMAGQMIKDKKGRQEIVNMHLDKDNLFTFEMMKKINFGVITEFADGKNVLVRRQETFDKEVIHLSCSMVQGAEFPLHRHDFYEYFLLIKGKLCERETGTLLQGGDYHSLTAGKFHSFIAEADTIVEIVCSKEPLTRKKVNLLII